MCYIKTNSLPVFEFAHFVMRCEQDSSGCYRHRVEALVLDEERRHVGRVKDVVAVGIDAVSVGDADVRYAHVLVDVNG